MPDAVEINLQGPVATLVLNRPESLNALNQDMIEGLASAFDRVSQEETIRCLVLKGSGGHFMAGGDLEYFASQLANQPPGQPVLDDAVFERVHALILQMQNAPQPILACVQGAVAGFGLSLMLACDLVLAAENTAMTTAYRSIGATPDGGMSFHLPRLVGLKKAMELVLLGDRIDARQALAMGLVNRVVPSEELESSLEAWVAALVSGPAWALSHSKKLLNSGWQHSLSQQLHMEAEVFQEASKMPDFREGVQAFLAKRSPKFN